MTCSTEKHKEWRDKNREHVNDFKRKNYAKNSKNILANNLKWKKENKEKMTIVIRNNHYKKRYGITVEEYNTMLHEQNGKCKICRADDIGRKGSKHFMVDHCHHTKVVRGLLCHACNTGLGKFKDNKELLTKAIEYLKGDL